MNSPELTRPLDIAPVLVLSTGRCGSTMVSEILNTHPGVLSLSEFFVTLGAEGFAWRKPDGEKMWRTYSRQSALIHQWLKDGHVVEECCYPYDQPGSRYGAVDMPPILIVTLPHLTEDPEGLFDELEPWVRALPRMPLGDHYRQLFQKLAAKFDRRVWVERSGGSLFHAAKLLRLFPEARVIHVYRDGRDTALSMSHHHNFRVLATLLRKFGQLGISSRRLFGKSQGNPMDVWGQNLLCRFFDGSRLVESQPPTLTEFGTLWNEMILLGHESLSALPGERLLNVRFEEVQQHPHEQLSRIIRFIDPSLEDPAWLERVARIPRPARSKFSSLAQEERESLTRACRPGLELLGYEN